MIHVHTCERTKICVFLGYVVWKMICSYAYTKYDNICSFVWILECIALCVYKLRNEIN